MMMFVFQMLKYAWMKGGMFCLCRTGNILTEGKTHSAQSFACWTKWKCTISNFRVARAQQSWLFLFIGWSTSRIALCLDGQRRFCSNTHHLLGKEATKRRHLRRMGYEVVQVGQGKYYSKLPLTWMHTCESGAPFFSKTHPACSLSSRSLILNLRGWELWRNRSSIFTTRSFPLSSSSVTNLSF